VATGKRIRGFGYRLNANAIDFSPDGNILAGYEDAIVLWDVATGKIVKTYGHLGSPYTLRSLAFSPDGKTLASGDGRSNITLWDVQQRSPSFSDYMGMYKFDGLDITFDKANQKLFQTLMTDWISVNPHSHMAVLRSESSEQEKNRALCLKYLWAGNLESAFLMFKRLPTEQQNTSIQHALSQRLEEAGRDAFEVK